MVACSIHSFFFLITNIYFLIEWAIFYPEQLTRSDVMIDSSVFTLD